MTSAPKCKVCGASHFGAAHVWPNAPAKPVAKRISMTEVAEVFAQAASTSKAAFDRVAYQREYMRKRRAKTAPH